MKSKGGIIMSNIGNYTDPSELIENDDIYDEETDYYTEDCDLCSRCDNRVYLNDISECTECKCCK